MPRKKTAIPKEAQPKPQRPSHHTAKEDDIPGIYQEMLTEAAALSPPYAEYQGRAVKRRRVDEPPPRAKEPELKDPLLDTPEDVMESLPSLASPTKPLQMIYDDFASSDESNDGFEDVGLEVGFERPDNQLESKEPLQLDLSRPSGPAETALAQRRKPATRTEKKLRLDVHKWHVLCLMLHVHHRNRWCDNEEVQAILKPLIPRRLIALLHLDDSEPQHARNHGFNKAIEEIRDIWQREWTITAKGMRRAFWTEDADVVRDIDDLEDPVDLDDFKEAAKTLSGSRDLGAQLFCALLRSVAVDTRLVFSLQPLPFSGVAKGMTPEKPKPQYLYVSHHAPQLDDSTTETTATPSNARWRSSEHAFEQHTARPSQYTTLAPTKRINDSPYPIFWTEVYSPSIVKWMPVDPLVRRTFNKPRTGFEPPASDRLNSMSYVIAFEDDGSARDVTRRYASQYNAKTRKLRVESTKGGEEWWKLTMEFFERPFPETRDEIEDNELVAREVQEGMPKNMSDFKGHPIFALKRHLRRDEVVYPLREAGKVSVGAGGRVESVYRRKDVHVVKSADQWYRKGRDVKAGEQPLKRAVTRRVNRNSPTSEDEVGEDGVGLYAEFQTAIYVPPPAIDGKVPRNAYGNLDVYVPSMIPAGAIHLQHPIAARAAKVLGVDYADAVTGFDFKGRQGTAVINGIVTANEYQAAVIEVIRGMEAEQAESEQAKWTQQALQMWRRFITALRIKEKIDKEYAGSDNDEDMNDQTYNASGSEDNEVGGGFLPATTANDSAALPSTPRSTPEVAPILSRPSEIIVVGSPHKLKKPTLGGTPPKMTHPNSISNSNDAQGNEGLFSGKEFDDEKAGGFIPQEDSNGEGGGLISEGLDDEQSNALVPEMVSANQKVTLARGLDKDLDACSIPDIARAEWAVVSPEKGSSMTATTREPQSAALYPLDTGLSPSGKTVPEMSENLPAVPNETSAPPVRGVGSRRSSDSLENESLLSHDPDDEDAEPEWLMDDGEL